MKEIAKRIQDYIDNPKGKYGELKVITEKHTFTIIIKRDS